MSFEGGVPNNKKFETKKTKEFFNMTKLASYIQAYLKNEEGATAIEYGLIAVFAFGGELEALFDGLSGSLEAPE